MLIHPEDFKSMDDLPARAAIFALERRYLDHPDWAHLRLRRARPALDWPLDVRFVQLDRIGQPAQSDDPGRLLRMGMQSLLAAMHRTAGALAFALGSDGGAHGLSLGVRADPGASAVSQLAALTGALAGNLPGSRWSPVSPGVAEQALVDPLRAWRHIGALTGLPSFKRDDRQGQDLERLVEALAGRAYRLYVIAEPIDIRAIDEALDRARSLSGELHTQVKRDLNLSRAIGASHGESVSTESNESQTGSTGGSRGVSQQTLGATAGSALGMAVALLGTATGLGPAAILLGELANTGMAALSGRKAQNSGENWGETHTSGHGKSESANTGTSETDTRAFNTELLNKHAQYAESLLDKTIERLHKGRGAGLWNVGVYLAAPDAATLAHGQATLRALVAGSDAAEPIRSIEINDAPLLDVPRSALVNSLAALSNPALGFGDPTIHHPLGSAFEGLSTPLNAEELSLWMALPSREVSGVSVPPVAQFGLNPPLPNANSLILGESLSPNGPTGRPVAIDAERLTRHVFITGTTGAGKTNTCLALIRALYARGLPFLVIEPAKSEYRALLADPEIGPQLQIFTLGNEQISPFRLNPFEFVPGFGLLTHIDLLKATFNAAFPMYASMPYLLEEAILDVYTLRGWDLATGVNRRKAPDESTAAYLPTLSDLYLQIDEVVTRKQYAQQLRMDLSAALKARISSLRVGSKGLMLDVQRSIPMRELLARPTILELQDLGDDAEKAFVMGLVLTLLYEYRQVEAASGDGLRHLTIIEEAHRLLKRVGTPDNPEIANPQGRAVETFGNILAEVREYGEGLVVIDQIASRLAPDILKNTNLKIVHRIMARDDRDEVGGAINLDEAQRARLTTLKPGEAVIHSDDLDQAVLVRIDHARAELPRGASIRAAEVTAHVQITHAHLAEYYQESWPADPLIERPGCATCRARCRYGARVARSVDAAKLLPKLARIERLKDENGNLSLTALDTALTQQARAIFRDGDDLHDLKHCILTHYTDDDSALNRHAAFVVE